MISTQRIGNCCNPRMGSCHRAGPPRFTLISPPVGTAVPVWGNSEERLPISGELTVRLSIGKCRPSPDHVRCCGLSWLNLRLNLPLPHGVGYFSSIGRPAQLLSHVQRFSLPQLLAVSCFGIRQCELRTPQWL